MSKKLLIIGVGLFCIGCAVKRHEVILTREEIGRIFVLVESQTIYLRSINEKLGDLHKVLREESLERITKTED